MQDLIIRSSRVRDAGAIGDLLRRSYSHLLAGDYPEPLLKRALAVITRPRPELLGQSGYLVALACGRIVAAGGWSRACPQSGNAAAGAVGHVRHLACAPDFLRKGIARMLMEEAIGQARAEGIRLLCCLSTRTAVPFYRSLGFEGDAENELRLQPGLYFPAVEMRKPLA